MLAGADALVDSRGDAVELVAAVRSAARGRPVFPEFEAASQADVAGRLPAGTRRSCGCACGRLGPRDRADAQADARTLGARLAAMIERLRAMPSPAPS